MRLKVQIEARVKVTNEPKPSSVVEEEEVTSSPRMQTNNVVERKLMYNNNDGTMGEGVERQSRLRPIT